VGGRGFSLHVGVNAPHPGWIKESLGPLRGCDEAARAMARLATERGVSASTHVTRDETRRAVVENWLRSTAAHARAGDLVIFTFAGHGVAASHPTRPTRDQALVCSDDALVDDRLCELLSEFTRGVRVVLVAEACHAGGIVRPSMTQASRLAADVLLIAATDATRPAWGAGPGETLPPFTRRLVESWTLTKGTFDRGYEGWAGMAEGVLNTGLVRHDPVFARQQPFAI
jgi:hypothetical protein